MKPVCWVILFASIVLLAAAVVPPHTPPGRSPVRPRAQIATEFADAYSAFAPLFAFHGSYADYLFDGSDVRIPPGLGTACENLSLGLALLHLSIVTQTDPAPPAVSRAMIRLRAEADAFCGAYGPDLEAIASSSEVDFASLREASAAGLFAAIHDMNELLEEAFTETYEAINDDERRWAFGVAFTTRALAKRERIDRIAENLAEIFYGSAERAEPPFLVSEDIVEAMKALIRPLRSRSGVGRGSTGSSAGRGDLRVLRA